MAALRAFARKSWHQQTSRSSDTPPFSRIYPTKSTPSKEYLSKTHDQSHNNRTHAQLEDKAFRCLLRGYSGSSRAYRSNTVQGVSSPETRPPKLPTRSKMAGAPTERNSSLDAKGEVFCAKGAGRTCIYPSKPIEKQAVSSSDGQLKGKYHKECFNCHTCHKPFPDKTFYVYDGKPLCAYHYHEANDSLCAAARCGQPIEGPCAVSHTGDRYHPEHMTCEYPGYPECTETLSEYWKVDGQMLCERHAHSGKSGSDDEGEEQWVQSSRAMKRVTWFINLTGGGALGSAGAGAAPVGLFSLLLALQSLSLPLFLFFYYIGINYQSCPSFFSFYSSLRHSIFYPWT
ncbi:uncharacterized protein LACBIDRAFT_305823 [Laccaria bicolor S238N-H82]|uniref:LIM zinc-binding domain-containing protein n=1 Tax=Laccaria bicolor (strain S238N-H82 / ATCC MYA-4686) TaxID=486041 RepID=B0CS06_LACBS|nr:uncharacterized protein LACBIDRAFT_305823 [Laccaria bicolor S238N-H82]EDR14212.1 hypothetical protein LACBIDRAFT_305823 [Laccaria bicolor S238N-H82]|eukprot:XP_001874771.1 hypothetical protein LACBIDRAFT_305823 [Laccaria bicolor S238N-H82]